MVDARRGRPLALRKPQDERRRAGREAASAGEPASGQGSGIILP